MSDITITWLGHSCFALEKDSFWIVLDPYADNAVPGLKPLRAEADLVLCSHEHSDHGARDCVTIRKGAAEKKNPWKITEIASFHDENGGKDRGTNTIRIFDDGEYRIIHMGDIGCEPTADQKQMLSMADVMMIPVGGFFTLEPDRIRKLVEELQPTVTIPMHYRSDRFGYKQIGTLDAYTKFCDDVVVYDGNTLELPEDGAPQTAILQYLPGVNA